MTLQAGRLVYIRTSTGVHLARIIAAPLPACAYYDASDKHVLARRYDRRRRHWCTAKAIRAAAILHVHPKWGGTLPPLYV